MMTLDEAIKHCKEVAFSECSECAKEHYQLMKWLMNLKEILEKRKDLLERKLESKKRPHCNGVNPNIIVETEAKLEEIEKILDLLYNE